MANQNPEQKARDTIDRMLTASGWSVQAKGKINLHAGPGQAVREYQTDVGPADYVLFVDGQAVGVIEAKREEEAQNITAVEAQTENYAKAKLKWVNNTQPLPFLYESTGIITRFSDGRDPKPRSREIFSFPRPETLKDEIDSGTSLRRRLHAIPLLNPGKLPAASLGLRDCQEGAVTKLEISLKRADPRALVQMATGSGKTYTAITAIYRLLKHAGAKRVLFLVDTKNLGEQAEQEMMRFTPSDDPRHFHELYTVQRLKSSYIPADSQVCISTIQRMYSILKGEELDESLEEINPAEQMTRPKKPLPVIYNEQIPPEFFDVIVIDECHRSIYNTWRQVLDYFDAFQIGLTATPDNRTLGYFNKNLVSEYTHEQAVADGVNVGNEIYLIGTAITLAGAKLKKGLLVEKREKLTRAKRLELQDEDETYNAKKLDLQIVNPDQIRTVIRAFRDKLPEIFPGRLDGEGKHEVPKTLIFAKTDSHADDIIQIVRLEFAEENAFCKKLTYKSSEDPKSVLAEFRNGYYPRIAVTVDMVATGTDVKPLECLLFMRDVKSRNYFEQMKGRGTRTLAHDDLKKVTPTAASAKTHYVIVDAIGVTTSLKTASQPLITKPFASLKDLAMGVMMGANDPDTVCTLAGRLARLEKQLDAKDREKIAEQTGGVPLTTLVGDLLKAIDPDVVETKALQITGQEEGSDPGECARDQARAQLVKAASKLLNGPLVGLLVEIKREKDQTIDTHNLDTLTQAEWAGDAQANAESLIADFAAYLVENQDQIEALAIFYQQPQRRREVTFAMVSAVMDHLRSHAPKLAPLRVWLAYRQLENYQGKQPLGDLTALVALIRRACGIDQKLTPFDDTVRKNFQNWIMQKHAGTPDKFTPDQILWLQMIRDHITNSFHCHRDDLEMAPFDAAGGLGKMYQLFGENMDNLLDELNEALVA